MAGRLRAALVATLVGFGGILLSVVTGIPALFVFPPGPGGELSLGGFVALFVASYVGLLLAAGWYVRATGQGWSYFDVDWPDRRDFLYVVVGVVGGFAALLAVGWLVALLDLPTTPNAVLEPGLAGDTTFLLVLLPLVLLVNAPAEELLFRNVVQKSLYPAFGRAGAVGVASVIFAVVHVPAYYNPNLGATAVSVTIIFVGSLVFGWVYARTDNVVVPSLVHGLFNAVQIALLYVYLTSDPTLGAPVS